MIFVMFIYNQFSKWCVNFDAFVEVWKLIVIEWNLFHLSLHILLFIGTLEWTSF
jgi:hypothetical protein